MPEYEYTIEEWSQDTRKWTLRTDKKLKKTELEEIYSKDSDFDNEGDEEVLSDVSNNTTFTFDGTSYGDDCQVEYFGDFESE
tara:strand:+ start:244 stop:489 length:246 start_codon:yes stop_codon:yes gene_type:complete